jgi:hypothetical protein
LETQWTHSEGPDSFLLKRFYPHDTKITTYFGVPASSWAP